MIEFRCRNCGQRFKVNEDLAGRKARCRKCQEVIVVPAVDAHRLVPDRTSTSAVAVEARVTSPSVETTEKPRGSILQRYGAWKKRHPVWNLVTLAFATVFAVGAAIPTAFVLSTLFNEHEYEEQHRVKRAARERQPAAYEEQLGKEDHCAKLEAEKKHELDRNRALAELGVDAAEVYAMSGVILDLDVENATMYVSDRAWALADVEAKKALVHIAQALFWEDIQRRMGMDYPVDVNIVRVTIKGKATGDVLAGYGGVLGKLFIDK